MRAETLAGLLQKLDMAPAVIAGGSGGARDSIVTVMEHPEVATRLITWSIVGGVFSTMNLAGVYVLPNITTARVMGMEALADMPEWKKLIEANPRNRERLVAIDKDQFVDVMLRWLNAFVPKPGQTIPGVPDEDFEKIKVPTLIIRGGENDIDHPKRTSFEVHCLIKGSRLVNPPWPEDAWERAVEGMFRGKGHIFDPWVQAAPLILDFCKEPVAAAAR
jgi:pimeloyl-ACP methyl ester carboxylesterase